MTADGREQGALGTFVSEGYAVGRISRAAGDVRFSLSVPRTRPQWENQPIVHVPAPFKTRGFYISRSTVGGQAAEAAVFWTVFPGGGQVAPCTKLLSTAGRSTADLAAVFSKAPGTELVAGPTQVKVGGRAAVHLELVVREDLGCDPGYFFTWRDEWWGAFWPGTYAGDVIKLWIVAVEGTRLVIEAETKRPESSRPPAGLNTRPTRADVRKVEREIASIVESIRFD